MRHVLSVLTVLLFTTTTGRPRHQSDLTDAGKKSRPEEDEQKATPAKGEVRVTIKKTEFRHTFEEPGFYRYHCRFHPEMMGRAIVQEGS